MVEKAGEGMQEGPREQETAAPRKGGQGRQERACRRVLESKAGHSKLSQAVAERAIAINNSVASPVNG